MGEVYRARDTELVTSNGSLEFSEPITFVRGVDDDCSWDVSPDGSHVIAVEKRPDPSLILVTNWFDELQAPRAYGVTQSELC